MTWLRDNGGEFQGFDGDRLVGWQRHHLGDYALLDVVEDYIRAKDGTYEYKKRCYGAIRSFFMHNRCELPTDPSFRIMGTRLAVRGSLTVAELQRILGACNVMYRCVYLCMFQGGLGVEELLYWDKTGYSSTLRAVNEQATQLRIELPGRKKLKNRKPYYSFIGRDGIDALRVWLGERPDAGNDIFYTQFNQPIGYNAMQMYWLKKLSDLAFITRRHDQNPGNRYGKNLHELRDLFKTRWRLTKQDMELADYFMGHDLDPLEYDKSPDVYPYFFENGYRDAQPWLNILSENPELVPKDEVNRQLTELREAQEAEMREVQRRLELLERRRK